METSYGVVWREGERPPVTGKLELLPRGVWLDGLSSARQIPYEVISSVRIGRSSADRIGKSPSVILERRGGDPVKISTVARPSLIGELAERLASLQLSAKPELWAAAGAWHEHVAGPLRIAEDAYSWTRGEPVDDVSYLPTPGPGDSD